VTVEHQQVVSRAFMRSDTLWHVLFPALHSAAPDRVALTFPDRRLTYRQLSDAAHAVAGELAGSTWRCSPNRGS
jgi:acyl-CoA synthetase (AMP-forming)/AMP-acid ligase II